MCARLFVFVSVSSCVCRVRGCVCMRSCVYISLFFVRLLRSPSLFRSPLILLGPSFSIYAV